jgi:lipopolysaccharide export LptBFGC system permease protein LptF
MILKIKRVIKFDPAIGFISLLVYDKDRPNFETQLVLWQKKNEQRYNQVVIATDQDFYNIEFDVKQITYNPGLTYHPTIQDSLNLIKKVDEAIAEVDELTKDFEQFRVITK